MDPVASFHHVRTSSFTSFERQAPESHEASSAPFRFGDMTMGSIRFLSLVCLLLAGAGCTSFCERYYIGVSTGKYGDQMEPPQFYRFNLRGAACFQRTEFQSGWYDKDAVDVLFSEIVTETSKRNVASGGAVAPTAATRPLPASTGNSDGKGGPHYVIFGPEGERINGNAKRFVIIMANNPKAIADEIDTIASQQEFAEILTTVLQHDERKAALQARFALEMQAAPQRALLTEIDGVKTYLQGKDAAALDAAGFIREVNRILNSIPK